MISLILSIILSLLIVALIITGQNNSTNEAILCIAIQIVLINYSARLKNTKVDISILFVMLGIGIFFTKILFGVLESCLLVIAVSLLARLRLS